MLVYTGSEKSVAKILQKYNDNENLFMMERYLVMKKRLLCLALVFAMTATQAMPVAASGRKQEIQAQKSQTQSKLSEAESQVNTLESKKNALMGQINSTQQELVTIMTQIDMLKEEIKDKETDIKETQEDLKEAEADRDEQYESMKKRIQYLYENGGTDSWAQILLESDSIADMLSKIENNGKMYDYDREALEKMKAIVQEVQELENKLITEKAELEDSKKEQEDKQDSLETKMTNLKAYASDYENQIATVKAQAQEYKNLIAQQNAELQQIQKEEEAAAKAAEEARRRAAAQAAQASNSSSAGSSASSESNTGSGSVSSGSTSSAAVENTESSSVSSDAGTDSSSDSSSSESAGSGSSGSASYDSATGSAVVAYASQFIGNPYVYGGNSLTNGIDCSGFTQQVFAHFGYSLPRTSDAQAYSGVGVSWENHRAGDIIVYSGHVAILTGDGGIVHASNSAPYPQGGIKYTSNALYRSYIAIRRIVQ